MLTEDEVLLHLGMRFQLGVLRYLDIKVKGNQNMQAFLAVHFQTVKIEKSISMLTLMSTCYKIKVPKMPSVSVAP